MGRRYRITMAILAVIVGLTLAGTAYWRGAAPQSAKGAPGPGYGYPLDQPPFAGAESVSLADARMALGGNLLLPNDSDASVANIAQIWLDPSTDEVDVYFVSGVRLLEQPSAGESQDVIQAEDAAAVQQNGGASQMETIDGVTAVITSRDFPGNGQCGTPGADCIPPQQNPSDVTMILDGDSVELTADWPVDQLVAAANTVA